MRRKIFALATLVVALPQLAFALSLDEAKSQGLVGERTDGYVGVVENTSEATALARDINSKRRAEYDRIAGQNGTERQAIEKLAAQKAYEKSPAGHYLQGASGAWMKK